MSANTYRGFCTRYTNILECFSKDYVHRRSTLCYYDTYVRFFLKQTWFRCGCDQAHPVRDMADARAVSYNDTPG